MTKNYFYILFILLGFGVNAQTISTTTFVNNNGSGTVTFNLQNTNSYDIIITSISGVTGASGAQTAELWYNTTPVSAAPTAISNAAGWFLGASGTYTGVANTTTSTPQLFIGSMNFIVPANTTWGMAITTPSQRYSTISAGTTTISAGGVNFITGTNIGYGGGSPPTAPGNNPRGWIGEITFMPACFNPTNVTASGITVSSANFSWTAVPSSLGYEYAVDQNPAGPAAGTPTLATNCSVGGLTINTPYYFHVRNKCASAFSSWTNLAFTTANAYCLAPTNLLFSNITTTSADILWTLMPTSTSYQYKYDIVKNIPLNGNGAATTTGITASLSSLQPYTKYYVYVRSICLNGGDSSAWKLDSFITKEDCRAPELNVSNPGSNTPHIYWPSISSAVAYEYRLTSTTASPAFGTQITDTMVDVTLDPSNISQYIHVRTKCNSQFLFSNWSTIALREVATSIGNSVAAKAITIFPNPADGFLLIRSANGYTYKITDMLGKNLRSGKIDAEELAVDLSDIASGIYLLEIETEAGRELFRFARK